MLVAHLVPGYFAAVKSKPHWQSEWGKGRRAWLWAIALGSTVAPDLDVIYNITFRGFFNHSLLLTHSLFPYLGVLLGWYALRKFKSQPYLQTVLWLIALGGLSHLLLDVIAHSTPLFYPLSLRMIGFPPARIVEGGVLAYISDPLFLCEPVLLSLVMLHWIRQHVHTQPVRQLSQVTIIASLAIFAISFLAWLPVLQEIVTRV